MSDGCQANTSTFVCRKVTSVLSYLPSMVELIVNVPPAPTSPIGTFFTAGASTLYLFDNELLSFQSLFFDLLLDGPSVRADNKVVLDYLPGNAGDVRWLPSKHIDICPQEGNECAFLFVIKGGADSERTISANQPCRDLLHSRCSNLWSLAIGKFSPSHRRKALQRGALPGFLASIFSSFSPLHVFLSGDCGLRSLGSDRLPIHVIHAYNCVLLV